MKRRLLFALIVAASFITAGGLFEPGTLADHGHEYDEAILGTWAIDFRVPVSPKGNNFGQPHRHQFTFSDKNNQRTVFAKEVFDVRVPGAWRARGTDFSATFEFTCPPGTTCGTIIMRGVIESPDRMRGRVAIFWDQHDDSTPTGLDTVTGTFTGEKCGTIRTAHDTGGCDSQ